MSNIDWSVFDQFPENTCYCRCGAVYRSHSKCVMESDGFTLVSRKSCPGCGQSEGNLQKASGDPEYMTLGMDKL